MPQFDFTGPISDAIQGKEPLSELMKRDFSVFVENCLRDEGTGELVDVQDFQRDVINLLMAQSEEKLIVLPRGFSKSMLVTVAYSAWRIGLDPNIRILIVSETEDQASSHLQGIETVLLEKSYIEAFGRMVPENPRSHTEKWNNTEKTVLKRTRRSRSATLQAAGEGSNITRGKRADLIIIDDIIGHDHATSPALRDAAWQYFDMILRKIIDPGKTIIIVNTRYHTDDLAGRLKKHTEENPAPPERFMQLDMPAIFKNEKGEEESIWESRFTLEMLKYEEGQSYYSFQANRMNNPLDMSSMRLGDYLNIFPEDQFRKISHECQYFIGIDPNTEKQSMDKDYFAAVVGAVHPGTAKVYIVDLLYTKDDIGVVKRRLKALIERYGPIGRIILEDNANQGMWKTVLAGEEEFWQIQPWFLKTETIDKKERIIQMHDHFMAERVHILGYEHDSGRMFPTGRLDPIRLEWLGFPDSRDYHWDALDAMEKVITHVIGISGVPIIETINAKLFQDRVERQKELNRLRETDTSLYNEMEKNIRDAAHGMPQGPDFRRCATPQCDEILASDRKQDLCLDCNLDKLMNKKSSRGFRYPMLRTTGGQGGFFQGI